MVVFLVVFTLGMIICIVARFLSVQSDLKRTTSSKKIVKLQTSNAKLLVEVAALKEALQSLQSKLDKQQPIVTAYEFGLPYPAIEEYENHLKKLEKELNATQE